ncbi:MSMEG_0565 family glycosyltransferase [Xenophilus azovorans]|uniref:MSMEG_0565 family glycosyltransferase n=1 Tax=Xenophilus azovorans TaxID=151755 RepID=UPI00056E9009|nr:MSMEG_0565 family glycosyltransferase [Xenophilus azovorans]
MHEEASGPHVGLLMHSVLPRGGVVHTLELAIALARAGTRVTVMAPVEPSQSLFRALPAGLPLRFHPLAMPRPQGEDLGDQVGQRIGALMRALPAAIRASGVDVLHAQDSLNGAALAQLSPAVPWLRTVHHLDAFADPRLARWQDTGWRSARAVCCVSDLWLGHLRANVDVPPIFRVFNGVDLQRFHPGRGADDEGALAPLRAAGLDDAPIVLAVGGVEERKNSARLLRAFARLRHEVPAAARARLVVAGGASLLQHGAEQQHWRAVLRETGLSEGAGASVWRTGALPDPAIPALMRRARLLALPSLNEGFGLVALEALACGTPVLVSRRAPFTEHLQGVAGVTWCEPLDDASIALGLAHAWARPRLPAAPEVCHAHSWPRSARAHLHIYQGVLATHPTSERPLPCLP